MTATPPLTLQTIPTAGARVLVLSVEHPAELVLSIQWPTGVHPDARVTLDARQATALVHSLAGWLGVEQ